MPSLFTALKQYLRDAAPGGVLSPEAEPIAQYGRKVRGNVQGLLDDPAAFAKSAVLDVVPNRDESNAVLSQLMGRPYDQNMSRAYLDKMIDMGGLLGSIKVFHGSPHKFNKFDLSKMGTGEGRQQQAHGAFLAEQRATGERYANRLSDDGVGNLYEARLRWPDQAREATTPMAPADFPDLNTPLRDLGEIGGRVKSLLSADDMSNLRGYYGWNDANDAPLKAAIEAMEISRGNNRGAVSRALLDSGIPGIRYLDAGSRGAGGTSNYVVFDDALIEILKRNGVAVK